MNRILLFIAFRCLEKTLHALCVYTIKADTYTDSKKSSLMMRILISIFLIVVVSSCDNYQNKLLLNLTNDSCKYWYRYNKNSMKPYGVGFCICKNGTYDYYYTNDSMERILNNSPVLSRPIWRFLSDSTIEFGESEVYKIISINRDSIILSPVGFSGGYLKLHVDKDQLTKVVPKSSKDTLVRKAMYPNL